MTTTNYIWNDVSTTLHLPKDGTTLNRAACGMLGRRVRENSSTLRAGRYAVCTKCRSALGL